jgi:aminopeptidase-like protein
MTLDELQPHLHSRPDMPDAIPYVTSYYKRDWGFCLTENQRRTLQLGRYHVVVAADLKPGMMNYGELIIPGETTQEILLSTYVCHPQQANDGLSGIVVTTALTRWIMEQPRRYTYRILFLPETIGAIAYLSMHREEMKAKTVAGFVVTCCGDEEKYTLVHSRSGNTLADRVACHTLRSYWVYDIPSNTLRNGEYDFRHRGSDERQYCSPGVDLPVVALMRSGWQGYPEYHTSADDLSVISPFGLEGGYNVLRDCLEALELNRTYRAVHPCEPFMGRTPELRALYTRETMDIIAYCDGRNDLLAVAEIVGRPIKAVAEIVEKLVQYGVLEVVG